MDRFLYATDLGFARRCVDYLTDRGCSRGQVRRALMEQLELSRCAADQVMASALLARSSEVEVVAA